MSHAATIGGVLDDATRRLREAGREAPGRDARLLLEWAAALPQTTLLGWPERTLATDTVARFEDALSRRINGEPVTRIIGKRAFWTLELVLGPATLDPRPDTETIVEAALETLSNRQAALDILDLGTGTGAILLALLSEFPFAYGVGVDLALGALNVAASNAVTNGLEDRARFIASDWSAALNARFDLVVSNPPYIASGDIPALAAEVREHDPSLALDGGGDGLACYRLLAAELPRLIKPDGVAILEMGAGQAPMIADIMRSGGLSVVGLQDDLAGIPRAMTVTHG